MTGNVAPSSYVWGTDNQAILRVPLSALPRFRLRWRGLKASKAGGSLMGNPIPPSYWETNNQAPPIFFGGGANGEAACIERAAVTSWKHDAAERIADTACINPAWTIL